MEDKKYIFYHGKQEEIISLEGTLDKDYSFLVWSPKIYRLVPKGISNRTFLFWCIVWWFFHYLRIFKSRDYKIFIIYHDDKIAHYSVSMPKYFRSSFMKNNDIQIGPIGTGENHRRKGLANFAINKIIEFYKSKDVGFWYLTREENIASRKCIENFGFKMFGEGKKTGLLKRYIIEKKY